MLILLRPSFRRSLIYLLPPCLYFASRSSEHLHPLSYVAAYVVSFVTNTTRKSCVLISRSAPTYLINYHSKLPSAICQIPSSSLLKHSCKRHPPSVKYLVHNCSNIAASVMHQLFKYLVHNRSNIVTSGAQAFSVIFLSVLFKSPHQSLPPFL